MRSQQVIQCRNNYTDDIIILLNFIFTSLHGYEITPDLSNNKQRYRLLLLNTGSSIVHGGTSAFFPYTSTKSRAQKYESKNASAKFEHNFTSAKLEILYSGNFLETICWEISWKLYAGKFLETTCWEIFWKLYAGNLLMETMCWEI